MLFSKCQAKTEAGTSEGMFCGQGSPLSESQHYGCPYFTELFQKASMFFGAQIYLEWKQKTKE